MKQANNFFCTPSFALFGVNDKKHERPYLTIFVIILLLQHSEACKAAIQRLGSNISIPKISGYRNGNRMAGKGKCDSCCAQLYHIFIVVQ